MTARALAVTLLLVSTSGASAATAADSAATPESPAAVASPTAVTLERHPPSTVRTSILFAGLGFTAAAYGITALTSYGFPSAPNAQELRLPVIGPWLALATNRCPAEEPDCGAIVYGRGILEVLSGLAQLGGLAIATESLFLTTETPSTQPAAVSFSVRPSVTPSLAGFSVVGTF